MNEAYTNVSKIFVDTSCLFMNKTYSFTKRLLHTNEYIFFYISAASFFIDKAYSLSKIFQFLILMNK